MHEHVVMHEPLAIATAIDNLNSWVRSESACGWFSSPRWAIYDWKRHFIEESLKDGRAENVHAIRLSLTCRDCDGTKRGAGIRNRKCGSTGAVTLRFLVTTICGFTWHTPEKEAWRISRACLPEDIWQRSYLSVDWEPNQKGRDLQCYEVAGYLNVLEEQYPNVPGSHGVYDCGSWIGDKDHKQYKLRLGRTDPACAFCGHSSEPLHWYGVSREFIEWSACACPVCIAAHEGGESIFKRFPVPVEKLQHPEIRKWLGRRIEGGPGE